MDECYVGNVTNKMLLVRDMMTKDTVFVTPTDTISKARSIMRKHGFRALPVVDKTLVGIISRSDVLKVTSSKTNVIVNGFMKTNILSVKSTDDIATATDKLISSGVRQLPVKDTVLEGIITSLDLLRGYVNGDREPSIKVVDDVMNPSFSTCAPDDELSKVWNLMTKLDCSALPVIKADKIVGMITLNEIIKRGNVRLSRESGRSKSVNVSKIMSIPAITVERESMIKDVARIMVNKRILRVPVVQKEIPIGMVDVRDILKAYL